MKNRDFIEKSLGFIEKVWILKKWFFLGNFLLFFQKTPDFNNLFNFWTLVDLISTSTFSALGKSSCWGLIFFEDWESKVRIVMVEHTLRTRVGYVSRETMMRVSIYHWSCQHCARILWRDRAINQGLTMWQYWLIWCYIVGLPSWLILWEIV